MMPEITDDMLNADDDTADEEVHRRKKTLLRREILIM